MLELSLCVAGIYACFLTWGVLQERVSTTPYAGVKFRHFVFLNMVQSMIAAVVALLYLFLRRRQWSLPSMPLLRNYVTVSILSTLASPFGYASLKHIDYPTMILGKSCKLIPVMLMNFILYRRTFPAYKYLVVGLVTVGVSCFMLLHVDDPSDPVKHTAANSLWGLSLLTVNLIIDGATNSMQDQMFSKHGVSGGEMMLFMNAISSLLMAGYLLTPLTSELSMAVTFCLTHPSIIHDILLFGLCGSLGQIFIFHTLERFGSLALVTVTVTRKMFSILLSVFWFNHYLSLGQWLSVSLVFLAIGLETYGKSGPADPKKRPDSKKRQ